MKRLSYSLRTSAVALVVGLVLVAMMTTPVAAQSETDPAFIVEVHADGSADVTVRSTLDLTTASEREAFQSLIDDEAAQQDATARFLDRMRAVANDAENATGREMAVTDATIDLRKTDDGDTGVVTLSVTWEGLAAVDGETLLVTEPFASGFAPDRPVVVIAPDGFEITRSSPVPDSSSTEQASWSAGADLNGFAVEFGPVDTPNGGDDEPVETDGQPGFGQLVGVVSVLALVATILIRTGRG